MEVPISEKGKELHLKAYQLEPDVGERWFSNDVVRSR